MVCSCGADMLVAVYMDWVERENDEHGKGQEGMTVL